MSAPEPTLSTVLAAVTSLSDSVTNDFRRMEVYSKNTKVDFVYLNLKLDKILGEIERLRNDIAAKEALVNHIADTEAHRPQAA